ncbi:ABC-type polar amino acid transport system ATPase subunit [Rhizobium sp. BK538]|nr:ABC-type polar amino acid transport system ATPase subunit [Rhizobium sp. BK538]
MKKGARMVVCGPSGSGKSTLMRCYTRLEAHQQGEIIVNGITLHDRMRKVAEVRKHVGMAFQHFNLFPHMTVLMNCMVGSMWIKGVPVAEAKKTRAAVSGGCPHSGAGRQIPNPAIPAAARGDCP